MCSRPWGSCTSSTTSFCNLTQTGFLNAEQTALRKGTKGLLVPAPSVDKECACRTVPHHPFYYRPVRERRRATLWKGFGIVLGSVLFPYCSAPTFTFSFWSLPETAGSLWAQMSKWLHSLLTLGVRGFPTRPNYQASNFTRPWLRNCSIVPFWQIYCLLGIAGAAEFPAET